MTLRTKKTEAIYQKHLKTVDPSICPFCEKDREVIREYEYWYLSPNRFQYDLVYKISHLLVCKRHVERKSELFVAELEEFNKIKEDLLSSGEYNQYIENSRPTRSIPMHLHAHLCSFK